ncbi:MAG: hypothetical protein KDD62_13605 [Bdellovibrionales bacterium]|nr:hypothetical protein [Bdellovibrionales bacterium]
MRETKHYSILNTLKALCLMLAILLSIPLQVSAQQFQRVDGTDYFLVLFPDATVSLGLKVNGEIQLVDEQDAIATLKKRIVTDKKLISSLNSVIRGRPVKVPNSKFFKPIKKVLKDARDGLSGPELQRTLNTRQRLANRRKLYIRAINTIQTFFRDKILPEIDTFRDSFLYNYTDQGVQKYVFGYYIGFRLPKKYEKASYANVCASFSGNASDPHIGAQMPLESEETITNDPCDRAVIFGDVNCPGALGTGILGYTIASSTGTGSGPSSTQIESLLAKLGDNTHQFRFKTRKVKCILK